jgi:GNAT superfamily N-acetyltransferase
MSWTNHRTSSDDTDFRLLVKELDEELAGLYGEKQIFYNQFNALNHIQHVIVAYQGKEAVGCGALKKLNDQLVEIKRMYVKKDFRNKGIAHHILLELEQWAKELHYTACVLETGNKQPDAIHLYEKAGYSFIPNYGQYEDDPQSVCMKKTIDGVD